MRVLTVYAHPNPKSFCRAILKQFTQGLEDAGHSSEVVDLYAIRFDPVFRTQDFASCVHESMPREILDEMNLKQHVLDILKNKGDSLKWVHIGLCAIQCSAVGY